MFGIGIQELIVLFILTLLIIFPFWFWALVDILRSDFTGKNKIVWVLVVIFLPPIGTILYFLIGRKQKVKT